jgi:hypothetical protein
VKAPRGQKCEPHTSTQLEVGCRRTRPGGWPEAVTWVAARGGIPLDH